MEKAPPSSSANQTPALQGPKAAEEAAAKINAMLAAQGKLAKSDPPPYKAVLMVTTSIAHNFELRVF